MDPTRPLPNQYYGSHDHSYHWDITNPRRSHDRAVARRRQRAMIDKLSDQIGEEYQDEILVHMEQTEVDTLPDVIAIDTQSEIRWDMRPFLLDFLIEAHAAFDLLPETLYLTVNILDRYCSKRVVYKKHYQLVGCSALLIAAKYCDRKERTPRFAELRTMCCNLYDENMFLQMEWHVLLTLGWVIGHATIDEFLQTIRLGENEDVQMEHLSWYICESSLFHREFVSVRPSTIARCALALSRSILGRETPDQSTWLGQYDLDITWSLFEKLQNASEVLRKKYASPHLSFVTLVVDSTMQRHAELAQRALAPATGPGQANNDHTSQNVQTMPNTPQKTHFATGHPYGYITPPITPDAVPYSVEQMNQHPHGHVAMITPPSPELWKARDRSPTRNDLFYRVPASVPV